MSRVDEAMAALWVDMARRALETADANLGRACERLKGHDLIDDVRDSFVASGDYIRRASEEVADIDSAISEALAARADGDGDGGE